MIVGAHPTVAYSVQATSSSYQHWRSCVLDRHGNPTATGQRMESMHTSANISQFLEINNRNTRESPCRSPCPAPLRGSRRSAVCRNIKLVFVGARSLGRGVAGGKPAPDSRSRRQGGCLSQGLPTAPTDKRGVKLNIAKHSISRVPACHVGYTSRTYLGMILCFFVLSGSSPCGKKARWRCRHHLSLRLGMRGIA